MNEEVETTARTEEEQAKLDLERVMILPRIPRIIREHLRIMCADTERRFNVRTTFAHLIVRMCVEDKPELLDSLQNDERLREWFASQGIA